MNIVLPCAICYGPLEGNISHGLNKGILFLLGTISFILLSVIATIFYFYYRSKKIAIENYGDE